MPSIYKGNSKPHDGIEHLPPPPPWRTFTGECSEEFQVEAVSEDSRDAKRAISYRPPSKQSDGANSANPIDVVNAALTLRRPILITGQPGTGKSTLAYSVAYELKLGPVLYWPISTRSTLLEGLYRYDAIGRLQASKPEEDIAKSIENFLELGPLGTAFLPTKKPRVLLIDEIDKSDIDLPNDLLNLFEEGKFEIPELSRLAKNSSVPISLWKSEQRFPVCKGQIECREFPLIFMTSNGERDFPAPFLRRCLRLKVDQPDPTHIRSIIDAHFEGLEGEERQKLMVIRDEIVDSFWKGANIGALATDQLLNAAYMAIRNDLTEDEKREMWKTILRPLSS